MGLAGLWCSALSGQHSVRVLVCSGEGEEGSKQWVHPPALPHSCLQAGSGPGASMVPVPQWLCHCCSMGLPKYHLYKAASGFLTS